MLCRETEVAGWYFLQIALFLISESIKVSLEHSFVHFLAYLQVDMVSEAEQMVEIQCVWEGENFR